jgi:hypothetical protein
VILHKTDLNLSEGGVKNGENNENKSNEMVIDSDDDDFIPLPLPLSFSNKDLPIPLPIDKNLPIPLPIPPLSNLENQSEKPLNKNNNQSTNDMNKNAPTPLQKVTPSFIYPLPHPRCRFIDHHTGLYFIYGKLFDF